MTASRLLLLIAISGFLAVALGAFGAHALREHLLANGRTPVWEKAVLYHFVHTLALLFILQIRPLPLKTAWAFLGGIVIFSGSLYLLAYMNIGWLGAITPVGGLLFLSGWVLLALHSRRVVD